MYKRGDVISGAVLTGLGVFIVSEARGWDYFTVDGPGPGFFPMWYGIAMIAMSLVLVVSGLRQAAGPERVNWREVGNALMTWAAFSVCVALLKVLGFLLAFGLLTLFVVAVMYRRPLPVAFAVAAANVAGFYILFPLALNLELPVGIFGF
ncbi:MAG: tripartite tricarboxylate transporter TctB family protein [Pseudomonadota bacterium]